jgi:hypothetical protein
MKFKYQHSRGPTWYFQGGVREKTKAQLKINHLTTTNMCLPIEREHIGACFQ